MKKIFLISVFCALCGSIEAASEINAFAPGVVGNRQVIIITME